MPCLPISFGRGQLWHSSSSSGCRGLWTAEKGQKLVMKVRFALVFFTPKNGHKFDSKVSEGSFLSVLSTTCDFVLNSILNGTIEGRGGAMQLFTRTQYKSRNQARTFRQCSFDEGLHLVQHALVPRVSRLTLPHWVTTGRFPQYHIHKISGRNDLVGQILRFFEACSSPCACAHRS